MDIKEQGSVSRRNFLLIGGLALAGAACSSKATEAVVEALDPTITVTPTLIYTPTLQNTQTEMATATATITATATLSGEEYKLVEFLSKQYRTDYPGGENVMGNEQQGYSEVLPARFKDYWNSRVKAVEQGYGDTLVKFDRMFGQLSLPVVNITDRSLDFDWDIPGKHPKQGLGFTSADLDYLGTLEEIKQQQSNNISRNDAGDQSYNRGWTIAKAEDLEVAVLAYVDEFIRLHPEEGSMRKQMFEKIIYGDLGIKPRGSDGKWWTVDNHFDTCETFSLDSSRGRSEQAEGVRAMEFDPERETEDTPLNIQEKEQIKIHDSRNSVLVVMVADKYKRLRVEVYDLSNPPDPLNPSLNPDQARMDMVRAMGSRLIPCGVPVPGKSPTPGQPDKTPGKTPQPSSTPQNPEPTATPGQLPEGTPTQGVPPGKTPEIPVDTPEPKPINTPSL